MSFCCPISLTDANTLRPSMVFCLRAVRPLPEGHGVGQPLLAVHSLCARTIPSFGRPGLAMASSPFVLLPLTSNLLLGCVSQRLALVARTVSCVPELVEVSPLVTAVIRPCFCSSRVLASLLLCPVLGCFTASCCALASSEALPLHRRRAFPPCRHSFIPHETAFVLRASAQASCTACPTGQSVATTGQSSCVLCKPGTVRDYVSISLLSCPAFISSFLSH